MPWETAFTNGVRPSRPAWERVKEPLSILARFSLPSRVRCGKMAWVFGRRLAALAAEKHDEFLHKVQLMRLVQLAATALLCLSASILYSGL